MKEVDVRTEIEIVAAVEKVAAFAANPDNAPLWYANIQTAEWQTAKPLQISSKIAFVAKFLGRRLAYTYEIVEWKPDERMVMRTAQGPFPMETTYTWESLPNGNCLMSLRNAGRPSGFSKIFAGIMSGMMRKANEKDLILLKEILEKNEI